MRDMKSIVPGAEATMSDFCRHGFFKKFNFSFYVDIIFNMFLFPQVHLAPPASERMVETESVVRQVVLVSLDLLVQGGSQDHLAFVTHQPV